jgi:predicted metal-dependent peptidase
MSNKRYLESSVYQLMVQNPYYAHVLHELNIKVNNRIPTAALVYDRKTKEFSIEISTDYFKKISQLERVAVLFHEALHFTHGHIMRFSLLKAQGTIEPKDMFYMNVAADLAINQYINNLPEKGLKIENFKDKAGQPFPLKRTMEEYYKLIKENPESADKAMKWDDHLFQDYELTEEDLKGAYSSARDILTRTGERDGSTTPGYVKDFLKDLDEKLVKMDYKKILASALKKALSSPDRIGSWTRPNKRYGLVSPGTKAGENPSINIYVDSSGSISIEEINKFLSVVNGFIKNGAKSLGLGLWHTQLYHFKKLRNKFKLEEGVLQSGGTQIDEVLKHIDKTNPNLAIIITDGYYDYQYTIKRKYDIFWIISGGNKDHPLKRNKKLGKTLSLEDLV